MEINRYKQRKPLCFLCCRRDVFQICDIPKGQSSLQDNDIEGKNQKSGVASFSHLISSTPRHCSSEEQFIESSDTRIMEDLITENKNTDDIVSPAGASSVSYIFYTIKKAVTAE